MPRRLLQCFTHAHTHTASAGAHPLRRENGICGQLCVCVCVCVWGGDVYSRLHNFRFCPCMTVFTLPSYCVQPAAGCASASCVCVLECMCVHVCMLVYMLVCACL